MPEPRPPCERYHDNKCEAVLRGLNCAEDVLTDAYNYALGLDDVIDQAALNLGTANLN